jgi:hypothetical protein
MSKFNNLITEMEERYEQMQLKWDKSVQPHQESTPADFDKMGYKSIGWANSWDDEKDEQVVRKTDDWQSICPSNRSYCIRYSTKLMEYYQLDSSD